MALPGGIGSLGGTLFAPGGGIGGTTPTSPPLGTGKNAQSLHLPSPHSGVMSTLTKGDTLARSAGHYGKDKSASSSSPSRSANPLGKIRGGSGGIKRIRGGLGPGRMGQPGSSKDYSMTNVGFD